MLIFAQNGRKRDALTFDLQQPVPSKWERFNAVGHEKVELSALSSAITFDAGRLPSPSASSSKPRYKKKKKKSRFATRSRKSTARCQPNFSGSKNPPTRRKCRSRRWGVDDAAEVWHDACAALARLRR